MPRPEIEPLEKIRTTAFKERTDIIQKVNEIIDAINSGGLETIYVDVESVSENEIRGEMSQQAIEEMWENPTTVRFRINGRERHFIQVLGASFNAPVTDDVLFMGYGELVSGLTPRFWLGKIKSSGDVEIKAINLGEIESLEFYRNQHYDTIGLGDFVLKMTDGAEYWVYLEGVSPVHRNTKVSTDDGILLDFDWGNDPYNTFIQWLEGFHEDQGMRFNVNHTAMGSNLDIKTFNISRTESWPEGWISFMYIVKNPTGTTVDDIKFCRGVFHWNNDARTIESVTAEIPIDGSSATWGNITGHLEDQEDLDEALGDINGRIDGVEEEIGPETTAGTLRAEIARLEQRINNVGSRGRFLEIWNCVTGKPATNPASLPFSYQSGDYYIVGTVQTTNNLIPSGSSYTGAASTTVAVGDQPVNGDVYYYNGTTWTLDHASAVVVEFRSIAGDPLDNIALASEFAKSVPKNDIRDTLTSTDGTKVLSARQGKVLKDLIDKIDTKGRLLGNWNDLTGKAHNQVIEAGFVYADNDYFIVETLGTTQQLIPYGTSYSETASTVVYSGTETVALGDYWVFTAGAWNLEHTHSFFEDFKNIAGTPVDNPKLENRYVKTSGSEKIDGSKTFTSTVTGLNAGFYSNRPANDTGFTKKVNDLDITVTPSTIITVNTLHIVDENNVSIGYLNFAKMTDGKTQIRATLRNADGTSKIIVVAESD